MPVLPDYLDQKGALMILLFPFNDQQLVLRPLARTESDLQATLEVYRQCEDFLALGPVSAASLEMVLADMELADKEGCAFCGIFTATRVMLGVAVFSTGGCRGDADTALFSLLMIAAAHRGRGLGEAVFRAIEEHIRQMGQAKRIAGGVQANNPAAIRFWRRVGFTISETPEKQEDGTVTFNMVKELRGTGSVGDLLEVEVIRAGRGQQKLLHGLLSLYLYEFTPYTGEDVNASGGFEYGWLPRYWSEAERHPFLILAGEAVAGFALVRDQRYPDGEMTHHMAEFFILRKYRRQKVGQRAAWAVFDRFPGRWLVSEMEENTPAHAFWRKVIAGYTGGNYQETRIEEWEGPVQLFHSR